MSEGSGDVDVPLQYSPGIGCEDKGAAFGESCSGSKKTLTACAWTVWVHLLALSLGGPKCGRFQGVRNE
eukprot:scaffold269966_cov24-Tisochrysis_lutea.AAC.1